MHTPGPWGYIIEDGACFVSHGGDGMIARCKGDNQINNARAISATPDLLAACELALEHCAYEHVRDRLRTAIAKATQ